MRIYRNEIKRHPYADHTRNDRYHQIRFLICLKLPGNIKKTGEAGQVLIHQDNLGTVNGGGGGSAQRHGHIGFFQGNGIIDTVSHKTDGSPLFLQLLYDFGLLLGQGIG